MKVKNSDLRRYSTIRTLYQLSILIGCGLLVIQSSHSLPWDDLTTDQLETTLLPNFTDRNYSLNIAHP